MENMTDKKRIVLYDASGQMCNRFWAYLDSVAWAMKNGRKVVIWHWDHNICCFDALRNRVVASFCRSNTAKRLGITASWYGSVPLAFIGKGQTDLCDEDFSVIHDFYHFDNGNEIVNLSDR